MLRYFAYLATLSISYFLFFSKIETQSIHMLLNYFKIKSCLSTKCGGGGDVARLVTVIEIGTRGLAQVAVKTTRWRGDP